MPVPRRPLLAATLCTVLLACAGEPAPAPEAGAIPAALQVVAGDAQQGIATLPLRDSVVVLVTDGQGAPVSGAVVRFASVGGGSFSPANATSDAQGRARSAWTLGAGAGERSASASTDRVSPVLLTARATVESPPVVTMLQALRDRLAVAITDLQALVGNPQTGSWAQAKLAALRDPALPGAVIHERRWVEASVASTAGRALPITSVFPLEAMRAEAARSVHTVGSGLPILERFIDVPFPTAELRLWLGFTIGAFGGGGTIHMEDQASFEARTPATRFPYEAGLLHELSHSYVGNEALTQFLESYLYGVLQTGSEDPRAWPHTRGWVPHRDENVELHALLDVYLLLGRDGMSRAYRALAAIRPPYAQPLSPAARQAFVDQAPAALKATVAAKVATITF